MLTPTKHTSSENEKNMTNSSNNTIRGNNIDDVEVGYSSIQIISILLAGVCLDVLVNSPDEYKYESSMIGSISLVTVFAAFCLNVFVSGAIANHISKIYQILSGSGESGNVDKKRKIILTWKYHDRNNKLMNLTLDIFWISLPTFLLGITGVLVVRYNIISHPHSLWFIVIAIITIILIIYFKYYHDRVYDQVVDDEIPGGE